MSTNLTANGYRSTKEEKEDDLIGNKLEDYTGYRVEGAWSSRKHVGKADADCNDERDKVVTKTFLAVGLLKRRDYLRQVQEGYVPVQKTWATILEEDIPKQTEPIDEVYQDLRERCEGLIGTTLHLLAWDIVLTSVTEKKKQELIQEGYDQFRQKESY